jgi:hypothetical protein
MIENIALVIAFGTTLTAALLWGSVKSSEALERKLDTLIDLIEDVTREQREALHESRDFIRNMMP